MKSLIILAIAVHLVTVKGSRIIQQDIDSEQLDDNGRDYISADRRDTSTAWENVDEIRGMGMIHNAHPMNRDKNVKCDDSACTLCSHSACLRLTRLADTAQLSLQLDYKEQTLLDEIIDVQNYKECKKVMIFNVGINVCITLSDTKFEDSEACTTAKIGISMFSKSFDRICM